MPENAVGIQLESTPIDEIDAYEQTQRDAEGYVKEQTEKDQQKSLQEQATEELDCNEEAQANLSQGKENLKQLLGFGELNVVKDAIKTTFVEIGGEVFYQSEDGSLTLYKDGTGEGFKTESISVEQDFRGPEFGGVVKIYIGSYQDDLGRTIHEFIEETYRAPENTDVFIDDEDAGSIESGFDSQQQEETVDNTFSLLTSKELTNKQTGAITTENQAQQKTEFSLESLFSGTENIGSNNQELPNKENNFLNLEFLSSTNQERINVMSAETKQIADVVTQEIRQNTLQQREHNQAVSVNSFSEKPAAVSEAFVAKTENTSNVAKEESPSPAATTTPEKNFILTATESAENPVQETNYQSAEKPIFSTPKYELSLVRKQPEISIVFIESTQSTEKLPHNPDKPPSPQPNTPLGERLKSAMQPVAATKVPFTDGLDERLKWGEQNVIDIMPPPITENLQQSMQELSHRPIGTEMVITGTEATADTALIFRVEQPGTVSIELYKTPTVEGAQTINPVTEITQAPAEKNQTETVQTTEQPESEPVIINEASSEASNQSETITIKEAENISSENRPTVSIIETPTTNQDIKTSQTATVSNNAERQRLTISSFFPEEDNEPIPSLTPPQQPATTNSRQLAA